MLRQRLVVCGAVASLSAGLVGCAAHTPAPEPSSAAAPFVGPVDQARTLDQLKDIRRAQDAVLANLANAQTPGYQATQPLFNADEHARLQLRKDTTPGPLIHTGRELDLVIEGEGFFEIVDFKSHHAGTVYTRAGTLYVNRDGELVLGSPSSWARLEPMINIPDDALAVSVDVQGHFTVTNYDGTQSSVGQVQLVKFLSPECLQEVAPGRYVETAASGEPVVGNPGESTFGTILQGHLEGSNVDLYAESAAWDRLRTWEIALGRALGLDPALLDRPQPLLLQTDPPLASLQRR